MDARTLREDALADNRTVGGNADAGVRFDRAADTVDLRLVDARRTAQPVVKHRHGARQRRIAGAFAQAVDGDMNPVETRTHGGGGVGHGQVVIVMGVEIEAQMRITRHQIAAETFGLIGIEHAQRVGAQEPLHGSVGQSVEHGIDVVGRMAHAVGPVLEVEVHPHVPVDSRQDFGADIRQMLFGRAAQLPFAMLAGAFGQQIHHAASGRAQPIERQPAVDEPEGLDALRIALGGGPLGNGTHGLLFALRDPRRGNLDAADTQFLQQEPGDGELLAGVERNTRRLLAVAQRRIHYFYRTKHRHGLFAGGFESLDPVGDTMEVIHVVVAVLQAAFLVGVYLEAFAAAA